MLSAEHAIVAFERQRAIPDRLGRSTHAVYVRLAESMIDVYRAGKGVTRGELHRRVESFFRDEIDSPPKRIAALCRLLDDASTFAKAPNAWRLRLDVFRAAAAHHPLVSATDKLFDRSEAQVKSDIAATFGQPWSAVRSELYADVLDRQRMVEFESPAQPRDLLSRYNVAQIQACLYRARRMTIVAARDLKSVVRHVKLLRLLHEIRRDDATGAYTIELTGPATPLLSTARYGVRFAGLIPPLLACTDWRLVAEIVVPWGVRVSGPVRLELSSDDGFVSHLPRLCEFDSSVESKFAAAFGERREGWMLVREGAILTERQKTFVPDFLFRHDDGTEVLMEIVGFWTPEYLEAKRKTLRVFSAHRILLAVQAKSLRAKSVSLPAHVVSYKLP